MLAMKKAGYDVVATIGKDAELLEQKAGGVRILVVDGFSLKSPIKNLKLVRQWLEIVKREQPDVIYANRIPQFHFLAVVSDLTGVPLVFAQAGGVAKVCNLKPMYGKTPITYSLENIDVFVKSGFKDADVHVITNRIPGAIIEPTHRNHEDPLRLLAVGNIKEETLSGPISMIQLLQDNAARINISFVLQLAGRDISKEKTCQGALNDQIALANDILGPLGHVEHLGWVEDIETIQAEADVCIGKGRSVLQPAMQGKVSFVLAESGRLTRITEETFDNLYPFNFSGRGPQQDSTGDFLALFGPGETFQRYAYDAQMVATTVRQAYLDELAIDKLEQVYHDALSASIRPSWVVAISRTLCIYYERIKTKLGYCR